MKNIIVSIIMIGICASLVVGVVLPLAGQIKAAGRKSFDTVKTLGDNIAEDTQ